MQSSSMSHDGITFRLLFVFMFAYIGLRKPSNYLCYVCSRTLKFCSLEPALFWFLVRTIETQAHRPAAHEGLSSEHQVNFQSSEQKQKPFCQYLVMYVYLAYS